MMRSKFGKMFMLAGVAALALSLAPAAKADTKGCSNATLKGAFSQRGTGFIIGTGPMANVGTLVFDGHGGMTGTIVNSINGNTVPPAGTLAETGTYTVNSDCTGTYTVSIPAIGLTGHAFFVIDDGGNEIHILTTDPGVVVSCTARRLSQGEDWR